MPASLSLHEEKLLRALAASQPDTPTGDYPVLTHSRRQDRDPYMQPVGSAFSPFVPVF